MIRLLCFVLLSFWAGRIAAQTGSDIILFDLKQVDHVLVVSGGKNITARKGYDNQPFFDPVKPLIYFASFNDSGRSDIKVYQYHKNSTVNLTVTAEREYSPTVTPDGQFISCIIQRDNGEQDLGRYPVKGGEAEVLINDLVIGYHAWINREQLLLFVLDGKDGNSLHFYDLPSKKDTVLANGIGRSLHAIPGTGKMSFVQRVSEKELLVKAFNPASMEITTIAPALPGQDHLTWLNEHTLLMSDGTKLYVYDTVTNKGWQPVTIEGDVSMLKGITRLAVNKKASKLAVVVSE